ncbi:MAG: NYN domain-containing protein [Myxococcota bacterium]
MIHVFVDNSNVLGGARRAARTNEPGVPWFALRVHFGNFFQLIERGRPATTRILGGSIPPGHDALWDAARTHGYGTDLLLKIEKDDGRLGEQGVDEVLHLKIANALLDHDPPQTLVLVTGDGSTSEFQTSFAAQVKRASRRGWHVEVWSWKEQLSGRFGQMVRDGVQNLVVRHLDTYYDSVTFVAGGMYDDRGRDLHVPGRAQSPLPVRR